MRRGKKSASQNNLTGAFDFTYYEQCRANFGVVAADADRVVVSDYPLAGGLVGHEVKPVLAQEGLDALAWLVLGVELNELGGGLVIAGVGNDAGFAGKKEQRNGGRSAFALVAVD